MKSNFSFLQDSFPVLANFGALAEQYCYSDSNSCLMKLGMIGETIVNLIFTYDRIPLPYDNKANTRIDTLLREGLITRDLSDICSCRVLMQQLAEVSLQEYSLRAA